MKTNKIERLYVSTQEGTDMFIVGRCIPFNALKVIAEIKEELRQVSESDKILYYCMYDANKKLLGIISAYNAVQVFYY